MMLKKFLIVLLCALAFWACTGNEPEDLVGIAKACFTTDAQMVAGTPINFNSSCSKNAASFVWDFGDGTSATGAAPAHTYASKGSYEVSLTITALNGATDEMKKTIEVADVPASAIISHFGDINADEVWQPGIHKIFGWVTIKNATVTIMPGAIIRFMEDGELRVGTGSDVSTATLIAEGTANQPIIFTADSDTPSKGFWDSIKFGPGGSGNSSMAYCRVEYGGRNSMVSIYGTTVSITNSKFQHSSGKGISLSNTGHFKNFSNNEISDCNGYVMEIAPNRVQDIGQNNNFVTSTGILISPEQLTEADVVWRKQNCPYFIQGSFYISAEIPTSLTIEPGVTVKFSKWAKLIIGGTGQYRGKLIAEGTENEPIVFTSAEESSSVSDWDGIRFNPGTDPASSLKYCIIEYAYGGPSTGELASIVMMAGVSINHTTIRHTSATAINGMLGGYFVSFENNSLQASEKGIRIRANGAHTLGTTNQILAPKEIVVEADKIKHSNVTWKKQPYPYYIAGLVEIISQEGSTLNIEAGNIIKFDIGGKLSASNDYGQGHLIAEGTAANPILFTSGKPSPAAGDYESILLTGNSSMRYCVVEYSGYDGWYGGIRITSDGVAVRNCTIKNSSNYGITTQRANPTLENNVFIDNVKQDYYHSM